MRRLRSRRRAGNPATKRAIISVVYEGAKTEAALPTVNATMSAINRVRRGTRAVSAAISGAPTTTPSAYAEIT